MERFIINNGNFEGIHDNTSETQHLDTSLYESTGVNDTAGTGASAQSAVLPTLNNTDATQVVKITENQTQQASAPQRRTPRQSAPAPRPEYPYGGSEPRDYCSERSLRCLISV